MPATSVALMPDRGNVIDPAYVNEWRELVELVAYARDLAVSRRGLAASTSDPYWLGCADELDEMARKIERVISPAF